MPQGPLPDLRPRDVVFHIGSGKTGTSSIQHFMQLNSGSLATRGVLYPSSPGRRRHVRLGLFIASDSSLERTPSWHRQPEGTPQQFRRVFRRRLVHELHNSDADRVVFSDEALYGASEQSLRRLRRLADRIAGSVRIVVYLRRQDDHFCSRYQQAVKVGEVRRMAERVDDRSLAKIYDYRTRLEAWSNGMRADQLVVRPFERERFEEGSLLVDFLRASGIEMPNDGLDSVGPANESLDAESVEFLRILNILQAREGDRPWTVDNREIVNRLVAASHGPSLTLPKERLDKFMARWSESNMAVARDLLGDPGGTLFVSPRKTSNTTTSQFLDPARVAHYADLLGLEQQLQRGLRGVAEEEARVTKGA